MERQKIAFYKRSHNKSLINQQNNANDSFGTLPAMIIIREIYYIPKDKMRLYQQ